MVNTKEIRELLKYHFDIKGDVQIDDAGHVHVQGDVQLKRLTPLPEPKLPVKFGQVSGKFSFSGHNVDTLAGCPHHVGHIFDCSSTNVKSLVGAPEHVGGNVLVTYCDLKNFVGGPRHVGGDYYGRRNPLTSLEGLPDHIPGELDFEWFPNLPVLRSLVALHVEVRQAYDYVEPVEDILNKYTQQGKAGAIKAAAELIRAGFKGNARW